MSDPRQGRGRRGEALACAHLERRGYRIVERNARLRSGELDLIALDRGTLCFVEVRLRTSHAFGSAEESVDRSKRRRLVRAAREWLATRKPRVRFRALRFDVVAIDARYTPPRIHLLPDAFRADP